MSLLATLDTTRNPAYPTQFGENLYFDSVVFVNSLGATFPVATTAGRVLLSFLAVDKSTGVITNPPTGWTEIVDKPGDSVSIHAAWKIADGTETTATWNWTDLRSGGTVIVMELPAYVSTTLVETVDPTHSEATVTSFSMTASALAVDAYAYAVGATDTNRFNSYPQWDFSHINERFGSLSGEPWTHVVGNRFASGETPSVAWTLAADQADGAIIVFQEAAGGSPQTVEPTGIASAEVVGDPTVTVEQTVEPTGIASAEAVGSPTIIQSQFASPTGIADASAVGTPTVTPGAVTINPDGFVDGSAVGTPTVTPGTVTLTPTGIASAESIGSPTVSLGTPAGGTVTPDGVASAESVGSPTVTPGVVTIIPTGFTDPGAVGTPTITTGPVTVSPVGISTAEAVGSPSIVYGGVILSPTGVTSLESVGTPTITAANANQTVYPTGIGYPGGGGSTTKKFIYLFDD